MRKFYSCFCAIIGFILLSFTALKSSAQLSGNYSIDPAQPTAGTNFRYFGDALAALNTVGVSDTTVFNIASGTYDTLLTFSSAIPGMGAAAPITFQSATGNAADVVLSHTASSSTNNYILDLNGACYLTFRNMTLQSHGNTYGTCILIKNGTHHILIESNQINGTEAFSATSDLAVIHDLATSADTNLIIRDNSISGGSFGIYLFGISTSIVENNNILDGNTITSYLKSGIYCYYQKNISIQNNVVQTSSDYSALKSVELSNIVSAQIKNNKISSPSNTAMYLYACTAPLTSPGEISNNFISVGGTTTTSYGLHLSSFSNYNIYHNSINCYGSHSTSRALYYYSGTGNKFKNNMFINSGGGYAVYLTTAVYLTNFTSDNNNLYSTGPNLAYFSNTDRPTIANWISATHKDSNSVSVDPVFFSNTDLHTSSAVTNNAGTPVGLLVDIDNESRNTSGPDIGADEYSVFNNDAGISHINSPSEYPHQVVSAIYPVEVIMRNYGSDTLTSATISWTVNGVAQTPYNWSGIILPAHISGNIQIGTVSFSNPGNNSIKIWTELPNGNSDLNTNNDTVEQIYNICASFLSGSYTIDPSQPTAGTNFKYFNDAFTQLNGCGVNDTTVFNIASGVYDTVLVVSGIIPGVSAAAPLVFQSATGNAADVVMKRNSFGSSKNYIVFLNGAHNVSFRNMTFESLSTDYGTCFRIDSCASDIIIENNVIKGQPTTNYSISAALIYGFNTSNQNNLLIRNNSFTNGSFGICLTGMSVSVRENNNTIHNNSFSDYYNTGIRATNQNNLIVSDNYFSTNSTYQYPFGISLSGNFSGKIDKNRIFQSKNYCLSIGNCTGDSLNPGVISNNFISIGGTAVDYAYGIYVSTSDYQDFFHNSVNCKSLSISYAYSTYFNSCSNIKIKNNIFANSGGGRAMYWSGSNLQSDYNNLYSTGTAQGLYSINGYNALADWTAATSLDSHSVAINPEFLSQTDFHTYNLQLSNAGTPTSVSDDIDNEPRNLTNPDIGADEFDPPAENAGINDILLSMSTPFPLKDTLYGISAVVRNFGTDTLTKARIDWMINGVAQPAYFWTGSLLPDQTSVPVIIGSVVFSSAGNNSIEAWTSLPNDSVDRCPSNDSLLKTFNVCKVVFAGSYSIDPLQPESGTNFSSFSEVLQLLNTCGVCDSAVFNIANGIYDTLLTFTSAIPGIGDTARVIFQSASGNASDVTLTHSANSSSNNYIVDFNGANYITFRKISFHSNGTSFGNCFRIRNNAKNITIEQNQLEGISTSSTSYEMALIYDLESSIDSNLIIRDNKLHFGSYGIVLNGVSTSSTERNNVVEGNIITDYRCFGIRSYCQKFNSFIGNKVSTNSTLSTTTGIYLGNNYNSLVSENTIIQPCNYGLHLNWSSGNALGPTTICNNFITVKGSSTAYGMYLQSSSNLQVFHNSINCTSSSASNGRSVYYTGGSNCVFKNNIIANTGGGYTFYSTDTTFYSDYNLLYSSGSSLAVYDFSILSNLQNWIQHTHRDSNSISVNPQFTSTDDLHTYVLAANNAGMNVGITTDIDGEPRNILSPDMGADEYSPLAENSGVTEISAPLSNPTVIQGQAYTTTVKIKNFGSDTLTKATIEWEINNVLQPSFVWTGTLLPDSISSDIAIGTAVFSDTGYISVKAWTVFPNDSTDNFPSNDTTEKVYHVCGFSFAGVYTIDPLVPTGGTNFMYFSDALNILYSCGVHDTTVFNIANGIYDTTLYFPASIPGSGNNAPIVFQSLSGIASDVTLRNATNSSTSNYVIDCNGSAFLAFQNMTIENTGSSYGKCIYIRNYANNITVEGNIIKGPVTTSNNYYSHAIILALDVTQQGNIIIRNNQLLNGSHGVYLTSSGYSSQYQNTVIEGNIIRDFYESGILISDQRGFIVNSNNISSSSTYTSVSGINMSYCNFGQMQKNMVAVSDNNGIYLQNCSGDSVNRISIANNMVSVGNAATANGIYIQYSHYLDVFYNTINQFSSSQYEQSVYLYQSDSCKFKNNIFINSGGGYAFKCSGSSFESDHNNLFSTGNHVAQFDMIDCHTLGEWQTTSVKDSNSISSNVVFISPSNLHSEDTIIRNKGIPVGISDDIDGNIRSTTAPDIGADEYFRPNEDAGVVEITEPLSNIHPIINTLYSVKVKIRNFGVDTLHNVNISWALNGVSQPSYYWTGSLFPDSTSDDITIGTTSFPNDGINEIMAWTTMPNDSVDPRNSNDTATANYNACITICAGTYSIDPLTPTGSGNFRYFSEVLYTLENCGISASTVFNIESGIYDTLLSLPANIPGSGAAATVTFKSATGNPADVVLQHNSVSSGQNYIIEFNGSSWITIKDMTLRALNQNFGSCITFKNSPANVIIENNILYGIQTLQTEPALALVRDSNNLTMHNIVIRNNYLNYGSHSIYSENTSGVAYAAYSIIENNVMTDYFVSAIDIHHQNNLIIRNNYLTSGTKYSYSSGIDMEGDYNCQIYSNRISQQCHGINLLACSGNASSYSTVYNNFVSIGDSITQNGISLQYSDYVNVLHNSVNCYGNNTFFGIAFSISGCSNVNIKNNIFCHSANGTVFYCDNYSSFVSDFNDYYYNVGNPFQNELDYYGDLSTWQFYTFHDQNSFEVNPGYLSNTDLHTFSNALDNSGINVGITTDIDGDLRNTSSPDIGADEFSASLAPVWPGDVSNDGLVDGSDLLLLGLNYNISGTPRDSVSNYWQAQSSILWNNTMSGSGIDMKYADCNGDGITQYSDTIAISQNFGLSHLFKNGINSEFALSGPGVLLIMPDTIPVNTPIQAQLWIGDASNPAINLNGLSLDFMINTNVHISGYSLSSLLATPGTQLKLLKNIGVNKYSLAQTKTDGVGFSGYGTAATITMIFDSVAGLPYNGIVTISTPTGLLANGSWINLSAWQSSFVLVGSTTVINECLPYFSLKLIPNPASAQTEISFTLPAPGKCVLTLRNTLGELIETTTLDGQSGKNSVNIDLSNLGQGIYVYTLEYKDVVMTRRLSVMR